jgi:hypothetical protein
MNGGRIIPPWVFQRQSDRRKYAETTVSVVTAADRRNPQGGMTLSAWPGVGLRSLVSGFSAG